MVYAFVVNDVFKLVRVADDIPDANQLGDQVMTEQRTLLFEKIEKDGALECVDAHGCVKDFFSFLIHKGEVGMGVFFS